MYRRKSGARLAELEDLVEQLRIKLAKLEKDKSKLQIELRDLSIEYETVSAARLGQCDISPRERLNALNCVTVYDSGLCCPHEKMMLC